MFGRNKRKIEVRGHISPKWRKTESVKGFFFVCVVWYRGTKGEYKFIILVSIEMK